MLASGYSAEDCGLGGNSWIDNSMAGGSMVDGFCGFGDFRIFGNIKIASVKEISCDVNLLPQQERQRYNQYKNKNAAELFLLGRTLLRQGLSEYYSLPFNVDIEINGLGKPYISPCISPKGSLPYFNISHSNEMVAVVFAYNPVGVDIEKIVRHSRETLLAMGQKVFSPKEMMLLESVANVANVPDMASAANKPSMASVQECFTKMWVAKEAYVKARGLGLAYSAEIDLSALRDYKSFTERILDDYFLSISVCNDANVF